MKKIIYKIIKKFIPRGLVAEYLADGKRLAFKGNNFYCPCCQLNFRTFLPFGLNLRLNALCPGCNSLERHRLLWMYLQNKTEFFNKAGTLFHVAPEDLLFKKFQLFKHIEYVPCAKFGEGYEDKYPPGTRNIDIKAIPYPNNQFDYIICNHVLEHIPDDRKAMEELCRVLKPGGWAILQVPINLKRDKTFEDFSITNPIVREQIFGQKDHVRVYGTDYKDRLEGVGFKVVVDQYASEIAEKDAFRLGINPAEDIYFCSKE